MIIDKSARFKSWDGLVILAAFGIAFYLCESLAVSEKTEDAVCYSVGVITAVCMGVRPLWKSPVLWRNFLMFIFAHSVSVLFVFQSFVPTKGVPGLISLLAGMSEIALVIVFLWKKVIQAVNP